MKGCGISAERRCSHVLLFGYCRCRSAHEVLRGDAKLLAPEETPEEVIRERQQRAAALSAVQDKLRDAGELVWYGTRS